MIPLYTRLPVWPSRPDVARGLWPIGVHHAGQFGLLCIKRIKFLLDLPY